MQTKLDIARNRLPRYTSTRIDEIGDYILLTNFHDYVQRFAQKFGCAIKGAGRPMQTATNADGLTIINFGMGSALPAPAALLSGVAAVSAVRVGRAAGLGPTFGPAYRTTRAEDLCA